LRYQLHASFIYHRLYKRNTVSVGWLSSFREGGHTEKGFMLSYGYSPFMIQNKFSSSIRTIAYAGAYNSLGLGLDFKYVFKNRITLRTEFSTNRIVGDLNNQFKVGTIHQHIKAVG
jgi:hypothetical protein